MTGSGAYVLADVLRTDRARLGPLAPDSPATTTLRQACRARQDLVRHRVAVGNQLRAHLLVVFPGAAGLFHRLDSAISLAFLARFGCQDRAGWLSEKRLAAWLKGASYSGRTRAAELYQRLRSAPRGATGEQGATAAQVTRAWPPCEVTVKASDGTVPDTGSLGSGRHLRPSSRGTWPRSGATRHG